MLERNQKTGGSTPDSLKKTEIPLTVILTTISCWLFLNLPSTKDLSHLITPWHRHGPGKAKQAAESSKENVLSMWSKL